MENVTAKLFGSECIVTVKKIKSVPEDDSSMATFSFIVDAVVKGSGEKLTDITISVPNGVLDHHKCTEGAKLGLTLTKDIGGTYNIGPEIEYL